MRRDQDAGQGEATGGRISGSRGTARRGIPATVRRPGGDRRPDAHPVRRPGAFCTSSRRPRPTGAPRRRAGGPARQGGHESGRRRSGRRRSSSSAAAPAEATGPRGGPGAGVAHTAVHPSGARLEQSGASSILTLVRPPFETAAVAAPGAAQAPGRRSPSPSRFGGLPRSPHALAYRVPGAFDERAGPLSTITALGCAPTALLRTDLAAGVDPSSALRRAAYQRSTAPAGALTAADSPRQPGRKAPRPNWIPFGP